MATGKLAEVLADRLPLIYSAFVILGVTVVAQYLFKKDPLAGIPFVGEEIGNENKRRQVYMANAKGFYADGYKKFKDSVFRITTPRRSHIIAVPPQFLNELKNLPDDVVSFAGAVEESMEAKYTGVDASETIIPHTVKTSLTPALVRLNPVLTEEVARTMRKEMPPCKDWTEVNIHQKLLRIVAIVSGRIFLGPELCHEEAYIDAAINYTMDLMGVRNAVLQIKPWLRPFKAGSLPAVKRLAEREKTFDDIIQPIVHARQKAAREDPGYQKPDDMLQWLIDAQGKFGQRKDKAIAKLQLGLSFAAIHTTVLTTTNAFYNLAAHPELAPELREECATVLAENDGVFTSPGLQAMKKVDSFLKETLRMHPASYASFERKVLKPITLSNGQVIPAGVHIEVPAYGVTRDPVPFPDPDRFDGLRFYRMREASESFNNNSNAAAGGKASAVESAAHNQFVSVSQNSLTFGYGRHACPGRFFAANEIKMILARALLQYDIKMVGGATERYPNLEFANTSIPDPRRTLLFKELSM